MRDSIGKLRRVHLREVWPNEARDFTTWLQENLDVLSVAIDLPLAAAEREMAAGSFSADLVAEDEAGRTVVIENQLEKSDHPHLGKLLTYLTALEADIGIWIVSDPRPEHVGAISWLNESSSASFYFVKVEAVRIGESPAAPLFTSIVGPSEETGRVRETKAGLADRQKLRLRFWTQLLDRARSRTKLHASVSATPNSSISTGAGTSGLAYEYRIRRHEGGVLLTIRRSSDDETAEIYRHLKQHRHDIESNFGRPLKWHEKEGVSYRGVGAVIEGGGYRDPEDEWPSIQDALIDAMVDLEAALRPHLQGLPY